MIKILSDTKLKNKMGTEGQKRVKKEFSLKRMVSEYEGLYNEAINNH